MGIITTTNVKYFDKGNKLLNKYNLDDRPDEYVYKGLVDDGRGVTFHPENFGDFTDRQKEIMKIYYDEESASVIEGYAKVIPNIQDPAELLAVWEQIRTSIIVPFQADLNDYHNNIISDYKNMNKEIENQDSESTNIKLTELMSEYNFEHILWDNIWSIDSISKVIATLIVAEKNDMSVEITISDS